MEESKRVEKVEGKVETSLTGVEAWRANNQQHFQQESFRAAIEQAKEELKKSQKSKKEVEVPVI